MKKNIVFPLYIDSEIKMKLDEITKKDKFGRRRNTIILECIVYGIKNLYNCKI